MNDTKLTKDEEEIVEYIENSNPKSVANVQNIIQSLVHQYTHNQIKASL